MVTPSPLRRDPFRQAAAAWACALLVGLTAGCGTTQQNLATQQLLESDAVDAAIAQVDFTPLSGRKVFFDVSYLQDYKGIGFVNANYVISGIRQQILAAGGELQDAKDTADVIVEGRLGTLGSDAHDVVYGIPKNNTINSVASAVPGSPTMPAIPELALAKKAASQGAAKLALFAYDRETRQPVWQSGLSLARSSARDTWLLGAGPFQSGTIHQNKVRFLGRRIKWGILTQPEGLNRGARFAAYEGSAVFRHEEPAPDPLEVLLASPVLKEPQRIPEEAATAAAPIPQPEQPAQPEIVQVSAEEAAPASEPAPAPESAPAAPPSSEPPPFPE